MKPRFSTICRLAVTWTDAKGQPWEGAANGVFVSPRHVLTNAHVIDSKETVRAISATGWDANMRPSAQGGRHVFSEAEDLALIELEHPITDHCARVITAGIDLKKDFSHAVFGLETFHTRGYARYDVTLPTRGHAYGHRRYPNWQNFILAVEPKTGHSGSPVFAEDGETVISLLTGVRTKDMKAARLLNDVFTHIPPRTGSQRLGYPFLGTSPAVLARWYQAAQRELGL